jgi:hypothetical protein
MFTDGISTFESSNESMWPIFLTFNELDYKSRFKMENVVLGKHNYYN